MASADSSGATIPEKTILIDRDQNLAQAPTDILKRAGVFILDNTIPSVFLEGKQTLVIWNETIINDPTSPAGGFDLSSLDLAAVEKIEILSPAQAIFYGAAGIGGAIRFVTRAGQKNQNQVGSGIGSNYEYNDQTIVERKNLILQAEKEQTSGQSIVDNGAEADGESKWSFYSRKDFHLGSHADFAEFYYFQKHQDLDLPNQDDSASFSDVSQWLISGEKKYDQWSANLFFQKTDRTDYYTGFGKSELQGERLHVSANFQPEGQKSLRWDIGSEILKTTSDAPDDGLDRKNWNFFVRIKKSIPAGQISHALIGNLATSNGLLEKGFSESIFITEFQVDPFAEFAYSEVAPTFYETNSIYGNSSLGLEKTAHAQLHYSPAPEFQLSVWNQEIWDEIDFDSATSKYLSHSRVRLTGGRLRSEIQLGQGQLTTTLEKIEAFDLTQNEDLTGRPDGHATFLYEYPWEKWLFAGDLELVGARLTMDNSVKSLPSYGVLNSKISKKFSNSSAEFELQNILGQKFENFRYQSSTGRTFLFHFSLLF